MNPKSISAALAEWPAFGPAVALMRRLSGIPGPAKAGLIVGGYLGAIVSASAVVWVYVRSTSGPDRDASAGMYAFGDLMLFIAVFGAMSLVPSALAFYVLRQSQRLWQIGSTAALLLASTSLATIAVAQLTLRATETRGFFYFWGALEFPRVFLCPFLVPSFGLAAWLAPELRYRRLLLVATGMEFAGVVYGFFRWFVPLMALRMAS